MICWRQYGSQLKTFFYSWCLAITFYIIATQLSISLKICRSNATLLLFCIHQTEIFAKHRRKRPWLSYATLLRASVYLQCIPSTVQLSEMSLVLTITFSPATLLFLFLSNFNRKISWERADTRPELKFRYFHSKNILFEDVDSKKNSISFDAATTDTTFQESTF